MLRVFPGGALGQGQPDLPDEAARRRIGRRTDLPVTGALARLRAE